MKRFLLVLFIVFISKNVAFSQSTFNPYKLNNIEWLEVSAFYPPSGGTVLLWSFNFYKLCGDTLFNGKLYKRIDSGSVKYYPFSYPPWMTPTSPSQFSFCCFFRQDSLTKSNFYRTPSDTADILLCSYNLNVGDTLKTGYYASTFYNNSGGGSTVPVIVKKDSILYAGKKLNILYTDTVGYMTTRFCHKTSKGMFLIEGLGHSYGLMNPFMEPFEGVNRLDSISFTASCSNNTISVKSNHGTADLFVSPNPSNGIFTLETNSVGEHTVQLIDVMGSVVLTQTVTGKSQIDAGKLPEGIYSLSTAGKDFVVNRRIIISK